MNIKKTLFLIFFLIVQTVSVYATENNVVTIDAIGTGSVYNGKYSYAKKEAIENALYVAVEKSLQKLIVPEVFIGNFQSINRIVFLHSESFIKNYKILAESKYEKNYKVFIRANLFVDKIKEYLEYDKVSFKKEKNFKILFFITEEIGSNSVPYRWWQEEGDITNTISSNNIFTILSKNGFKVFNTKIIERRNKIEKRREAVDKKSGEDLFMELLEKEETQEVKNEKKEVVTSLFPIKKEINIHSALKIAKELNVDLVVLGDVKVFKIKKVFNNDLVFYKGVINSEIFDVKSGKKIGEVEKESVVNGETEESSIKKATEEISSIGGNTILKKLEESLNKRSTNIPTKIEVVIEWNEEVDGMAEFIKIRKKFTSLDGIKNIETKELGSDKATIIIDYKAEAKNLVTQIIQNRLNDNFNIEISDFDKIKITLSK